MRSSGRVVAICLLGWLGLLVMAASAFARPKPITGKLSRPGFTVIAVTANGTATFARTATDGRFRLPVRSGRLALSLRAPSGKYAGPIVLARRRTRAIVGARAGARLGKVLVRTGYAKVARRLAKRSIDATRWARARKGVPIGNGRNFGFVRSRPPRSPPPGDKDADGVSDSLDVDGNGNLTLDSFEPSSARAAQSGPTALPTTALGSDLTLRLDQTANVDAVGSTAGEIDAALATYGRLALVIVPGGPAELDCGGRLNPSPPPLFAGGLAYCSHGGTGRLFSPPMSAFPDCCDEDQDGFGTLVKSSSPQGPIGTMFLSHGATSTQIGTGDVLIEHVATNGDASRCPPGPGVTNDACASYSATLQFVFATVPALVFYADTAGHSAAVSYPVPANGPGTQQNGFAVGEGPDGHVVLTVSLWRPQRRPLGTETGDWIDVGGLRYTVLAGGGDCPQSSFSTQDPNLAPVPPTQVHGGGFLDRAPDQPANPANRLTFTLDATDCLNSKGQSWKSGQTQQLSFFGYTGDTGQENAEQPVFFKLQP